MNGTLGTLRERSGPWRWGRGWFGGRPEGLATLRGLSRCQDRWGPGQSSGQATPRTRPRQADLCHPSTLNAPPPRALPQDEFRETPTAASRTPLPHHLEGVDPATPIMMYCTGGIRCDVYSTHLRAQG